MASKFQIYNSFEELVNYIYVYNTSDLIHINEYNIPISNKYYFTLLDHSNPTIKSFFEYIFDKTRIKENNIKIKEGIDTSLDWEEEQFLNINLEESNIQEMDEQIDQLEKVIQDSKSEFALIIDINYLINFVNKFRKLEQQIHLIDMLLYKLKNFSINKIIVLDEDNNYQENNLLYQQIKCVLQKNKYVSNNKIILYKDTQDDEHNIYWRILQDQSFNLDTCKKIESPIENSDNFYVGTYEDSLCYISETTIHKIIEKNIFELYYKPGIVIDPIDKINLIM